MANRLQKQIIADYRPAVAYKPAVPARCIQVERTLPAGTVISSWNTGVDRDGVTHFVPVYKYVPARTVYETVCYSAQPEVKARPASIAYTAITGWNAGARSIDALAGDGYVEFSVNGGVFGAVVGLSNSDNSRLPSEQSHAFYLHSGVVDIMEYGRVVAVAVAAHSPGNVYRITRAGAVVTYSVGSWSLLSSIPSAGAVVLDASLYASGDYVDNPSVVAAAQSAGAGYGSFKALIGHGAEGEYAYGAGSFAAMEGSGFVPASGSGAGEFRALQGLGADYAYGAGYGEFAALAGEGDGGYPQISIATGVGIFAPLAGVGVGLTGEIGSGSGSFQPLTGMAADRVYGQGGGSFQPLTGFGESSPYGEFESYFASPLALMGLFTPDELAGDYFSSGLQIGSSFDLVVFVEGFFQSGLLLGSIWESDYATGDYFTSAIRIGGSISGMATPDDLAGQMAMEPAQYAVNVQTGALTQYVGFAFLGFTQVGQELYACRSDGVYRVRHGDDDGEPLQALIDLGATDYGSSQIKRLGAVYFGLETDGDVTMRLATDSGEQAYRVARHGVMDRVVTAKGASGRLWNMTLEIEDATHFELDAIEAQVGATTRRLGRR